MDVTVKTFADLRKTLGQELVLSIPDGGTVRDLLRILGERYAAFSPEGFESEGRLKPDINILQNGRNIKNLDDLDTKIAERDVIAIFPPIAGG